MVKQLSLVHMIQSNLTEKRWWDEVALDEGTLPGLVKVWEGSDLRLKVDLLFGGWCPQTGPAPLLMPANVFQDVSGETRPNF